MKKLFTRRISLFIVFLFVIPIFSTAAQSGQGTNGLVTVLGVMVAFFTSTYMKAILTIALGGLAVGLIMNRGEPGVIKKFIPWIAACILLLSLSGITGLIFAPANSAGDEITPATSLNF
jgi:hypothetical protein